MPEKENGESSGQPKSFIGVVLGNGTSVGISDNFTDVIESHTHTHTADDLCLCARQGARQRDERCSPCNLGPSLVQFDR